MQESNEFGQALSEILHRRKCSTVELAKRLGYKSHTSVARILHRQAGHSIKDALYKRLLLTNALLLSGDEQQLLAQCLENDAFPPETHEAHQNLWDFLFAEQRRDPDCTLTLYREGAQPQNLGKDEWRNAFINTSDIDIIIMGCCHVNFFAFLSQSLVMHEKTCRIRHYCDLNTKRGIAINAMICAAMMIRYRRYEAFYLQDSSGENTGHKLPDGQVYIRWSEPSGVQRAQILYTDNGRDIMVYDMPDGAQYRALLEAMLQKHSGAYSSIRYKYLDPDMAENYLDMSRRGLFFEKGRAQRAYRMTPCYSHISMDTLKPAFLSLLQCAESHPVAKQLMAIHTERYQNMYSIRGLYKLVISVSGMWDFIKTGILTEHLAGLAPVNAEGRLKVLRDMFHAAKNNPFFHFCFLHEDVRGHNLIISSHDGLGIYLIDPANGYNAKQTYYEDILSVPAFIEAFNSFFDNILVKKHAYTEMESLKKLSEMIRWLEVNLSRV